ncbi:MAG: hypothetical protein FWH04_05295 [Oscillospiraceae bacterium]|nr:hypothetical protein [Oscillospiraceae bacterium]
MPDYKAMYYHLAGRMAVAIDAMECTVKTLQASADSLVELTEKLKLAHQTTEDMFIESDDEEGAEDG